MNSESVSCCALIVNHGTILGGSRSVLVGCGKLSGAGQGGERGGGGRNSLV